MVDKFWLVKSAGCGAATVQHTTKASAVEEAKRLAEKDPTKTFCVLEVVEAYAVAKPPVEQVMVVTTNCIFD
jgi:hypothetical protein